MESSTISLSTNATFNRPDDGTMRVFQVVITLFFGVIMFGMGCTVEYAKLLEKLKKPVGIAVGLFCQIIIMPTLTYVLIKIFGMSTIHAIAFMLTGCSPGGNASNIVVYLVRGDMSLSVAMTSFSNLLALGSIPLWVLIFTNLENIDDSLQIPHLSLVISLLTIVIPVSAGIAFRYKFPNKSRLIPKVCAIIGIIVLIVTMIVMLVVTKMPFVFDASTIAPVGLLPLVGLTMAYLMSCIPQLKQTRGARKAIALEAAIQNPGVANSILLLSFGHRPDLIGSAVTVPLLYAMAQALDILVIVISYRIWYRCRSRHKNDEKEQEAANGSDDAEDTENVPLKSRKDCEQK